MIYQLAGYVDLGGVAVETVGQEIEAIRAAGGGVCSPEEYVERARPEGSPIHDTLPWNDREMAEEARRQRARSILRVVVVQRESDEDLSPNVSVVVPTPTGPVEGYIPMVEVLLQDDLTRQTERKLLGRVRGDLQNHIGLPLAQALYAAIAPVADEWERDGQK